MQMSWSASFFKRFLFGASKAYVQQLDRGKSYRDLCPVYSLAILNDVFEPHTEAWYHHYRLAHRQLPDKTLEGIELVFCELPKFTPQTRTHRHLGALWLRFLKELPDLTKIPQEFEENPELKAAFELAQEASYTREELEFYDQHLDAVRVEQTVRADGFAEGKEEGLAEG
ncbi:MAG: Rpn family recombination-promoting nuclease/putative transposase, partial [Alphaproteobacteria bacterium]